MIDNDKFLFYSKSADKKPDKGTGEYVNDIKIYKELSEIPNWRHASFILDDNEWNSVYRNVK